MILLCYFAFIIFITFLFLLPNIIWHVADSQSSFVKENGFNMSCCFFIIVVCNCFVLICYQTLIPRKERLKIVSVPD